jgi:sRNA-binding carbon storage regulator CsrA
MLLIERRDKQRVLLVVGDIEIWVGVTSLGSTKSKIAIDAPRSVQILREEMIKTEEDIKVLKAISKNEIRKEQKRNV